MEIENIELSYLSFDDYQELKEAMIESYTTMPQAYWREHQIKSLINRFPDGQVVIKVNGQIAGCALSIIVNYHDFEGHHTYEEITGKYTFDYGDLMPDTDNPHKQAARQSALRRLVSR